MSCSEERIKHLLDCQSFCAHFPYHDTHFICGEGMINQQPVFIIMNRGGDCEFNVLWQWKTIDHIIQTTERAAVSGVPLIYIQDKLGGIDTHFNTTNVFSEDMSSLLLSPSGMGKVSASLARFAHRNVLISVILGPTSGPLALPLMLADLVLMTDRGAFCMGRPDMVKAMLAETSDLYSLGGATMHARHSGQVQCVFETETVLFSRLRTLFSLLFPRQHTINFTQPDEVDVNTIIPTDHRVPYDMHRLLSVFIDKESFFECSPDYAQEVITGWAKVQGNPFIIIANNPKYKGGAIYRQSATKMVRVINLATKCHTPILFIADVPGFMIGKVAESSGIFLAAAELFKAHVNCEVPKLFLVARKAYTGGVFALGGPGFNPTAVLAYPQANVGVYSVETINKIMATSLNEREHHVLATLKYEVSHPERLKDKGLLTDVITISQTREKIMTYLFSDSAYPANV